MKAVRIHSHGDASVLVLEDAPIPEIGPDEILIKVKACGVNPIDWKIRRGFGEKNDYPFPFILGWDVAGTIESKGALIASYELGDKVFARGDTSRNGAYAEYVSVRAIETALAPETISLTQAAAVPLACQTAWAGLFEQGNLRAKQSVLIHGAAGGVGSFAIQLAKLMGAAVIATTSTQNIEFVKSLGADEVIDYTKQDFSKKLQGIDLVFDPIGGDTQKKSWGIIKKDGILVSTVGANQEDAKKYRIKGKSYKVDSSGARLKEIAKLIDKGDIKIIIEKEFPLAEARAAHELSESGRAKGKIILTIS